MENEDKFVHLPIQFCDTAEYMRDLPVINCHLMVVIDFTILHVM